MNFTRFASGFLAIALLTVPAIGSAQANGSNQYNGVISSVNGGTIALQNGPTVFLHNGTVINPGGTRLEPGMRISISGSPAGNGNINANQVDVVNLNGYNGSGNGAYSQYSAVISSVQGSAIALQNGYTVFLKDGTVITPNGTRLEPGNRISVTGTSAGDGNINATRVDVVNDNVYNGNGYNNNGYNGNNNGNNNNNNGSYNQYSAVISSVQGSAIALQNGYTVFLKNGTVINPSGTRLMPGMRISISGTSAGNGNINASQVDVVNGNGYNGNNR